MENRRKIYIILGILVAIIPLLGFPNSFRTLILVFLGLLIAGGAFFSGRMTFTTSMSGKDKKEVVTKTKEDLV